ncbi:helix-turn-helix domain-containing protein [Fulvivirga sedimenti]|uniref:Helix-turn-helix domain-containing protein n=1 Tax=Fulvivirga sedimenti TaxID=2879465 RepID=A0A9X1HU95_9BACT|nr:helix-turn-helix domain-containing protein [Fulvivirga sedimenti]MCA6075105.1 helix-turn-helix domain-containing protein [Fulvivirga sedimenti]MCA6076282.1 helix-turn-helix domain-containing protein [Fulvivirga sedimenti]MCA6077410.1 helix-turn-helix domain-containing protein [Fulvivirga sedimenti]
MPTMFIEAVRSTIQNNLSREHYGVNELAVDMGMSRSQLLRRIKESTGLSVSEFIRNERLGEARVLLKTSDHSISEIAYLVGFSSPSYFVKCFHDSYGETPGDFRSGPSELTGTPERRRSVPMLGIISLTGVFLILAILLGIYFPLNRDEVPDSIAVLPFSNLSEAEEFVSDGLTESVINDLASADRWRVISRASVMRFKDDFPGTAEIARQLDVDLIVSGSIQQIKDSIWVNIQLIKPLPEEHQRWIKRYSFSNIDILSLSELISADIKNQLDPEFPVLSEMEINEYSESRELYLKGAYFLQHETPAGLEKSIKYLLQSIQLDSTYSPSFSALSRAYISQNRFLQDIGEKKINHEKSLKAARNALALNKNSASAYIAMARVNLLIDWDWGALKRNLQQALMINPSLSEAHELMSHYYALQGEYSQAIEEAATARRLDPLNPAAGTLLADRYYIASELENAIDTYQGVLELFPDYSYAWDGLGYAYFYSGNKQQALKCWQNFQNVIGNEVIAEFYTEQSFNSSLRYWLEKAMGPTPQTCSNPTVVATVYMMLDQPVEAIDYLEIAFEFRDERLPLMLIRPDFYNLRINPRFKFIAGQLDITLPEPAFSTDL